MRLQAYVFCNLPTNVHYLPYYVLVAVVNFNCFALRECSRTCDDSELLLVKKEILLTRSLYARILLDSGRIWELFKSQFRGKVVICADGGESITVRFTSSEIILRSGRVVFALWKEQWFAFVEFSTRLVAYSYRLKYPGLGNRFFYDAFYNAAKSDLEKIRYEDEPYSVFLFKSIFLNMEKYAKRVISEKNLESVTVDDVISSINFYKLLYNLKIDLCSESGFMEEIYAYF